MGGYLLNSAIFAIFVIKEYLIYQKVQFGKRKFSNLILINFHFFLLNWGGAVGLV